MIFYPMDPQTVDLGFVLRQFDKFTFDISNQDKMFRLQHFVYLLQAHGISLGFSYSWNLRGPFSTTLYIRAKELECHWDNVPTINARFLYDAVQDKFLEFSEFIRGKEDDDAFLSVVSALHMEMSKHHDAKTAIEKILSRNECITYEKCDAMLQMYVIPLFKHVAKCFGSPTSLDKTALDMIMAKEKPELLGKFPTGTDVLPPPRRPDNLFMNAEILQLLKS